MPQRSAPAAPSRTPLICSAAELIGPTRMAPALRASSPPSQGRQAANGYWIAGSLVRLERQVHADRFSPSSSTFAQMRDRRQETPPASPERAQPAAPLVHRPANRPGHIRSRRGARTRAPRRGLAPPPASGAQIPATGLALGALPLPERWPSAAGNPAQRVTGTQAGT